VVTVSSAGYTLYPKINFESLRDGPERKKMAAFDLYNQSKFVRLLCAVPDVSRIDLFHQGNCVFSVELSRRCSDKGIVSVAVHPGASYGIVRAHPH
jgi:retinol dehydrogenase-12